MQVQHITPAMVKQKVFALPVEQLQEAYDFIDFLLSKSSRSQKKRVQKLEGIWEGLGFERISKVEQEIRAIRDEADLSLSKRIEQCGM